MFENSIRERVAARYGESSGGDSFYRCPGAGCEVWESAAGDYQYKVETKICDGCTRCHGKFPLLNESNSPEETQKRIVGRIEDLTRQENAGHLDKELLEYWEWRLIEIWRDAELTHERNFKIYTKAIFDAMYKQN